MRQVKRTPCEYQDADFLQFSALSNEQILGHSVLQIDEDRFYQNGHPVRGGLFDQRLGVSGPNLVCQTCAESTECPGHFGHIRLCEPVLHYGYLEAVAKIMRCVCHRCFRIKRGTEKQLPQKVAEIKRIADPLKRLSLMSKLLQNIKKCSKQVDGDDMLDKNFHCCGSWIPTQIAIKNFKISYLDDCGKTRFFTRREIKALLEGISMHETDCSALGFTKTKPIDLLIQSLIVCPPQARPYVLIQNQQKCQDDLSVAYLKILRLNKRAQEQSLNSIEKTRLIDEMEKIIASIMINLNVLNSDLPHKSTRIKSISERLKGKQGRFRQNLLGKRVDFSARTVISPDPNISLSEIGIPQKIAKALTYPEKISPLNFNKVLDLLVARKVKYLITPPENGLRNTQKIINVNKIEASTKQDLKSYLNHGMIAERVLEDGDYVLLNRQPTLHRMSMMAHKVRILPGSTFRINPTVCTPYNADFDGDQMNIHVPQSYQTVSQLKNIASVKTQIVGPKNGTTSMGFSQDSLLGAYLMTSRDNFLTREDFMNLIAKISNSEVLARQVFNLMPMPAILQPQALWTGKQLISMIIPKQVYLQETTPHSAENVHDLRLVIKRGQLLSGILQKEHIGSGSSKANIIHYIWTQVGPESAEWFMNDLQQIISNWLLTTGFSIGVADIVPQASIVSKKCSEYAEVENIYYELFNLFRHKEKVKSSRMHQEGRNICESLEFIINLKLNNHLSKIQEAVKLSLRRGNCNNIYKIVEIKSKGSETNLAQILYSVGNQNVDGRRCPVGFSKRSLPHFPKNDNSPFARGYVLSSFYEGLKPQQFFFHSMGGREGLSDTAIKTSNVGYIQRKLVKSLEDIIIKYDGSVRDSRGNILQHCYGQDGFLPQSIERHHCHGAQKQPKAFREAYRWKQQQLKKLFHYKPFQIAVIRKQYSCLYRNRKIFRRHFSNRENSQRFDYFCPISVDRILKRINQGESARDSKVRERADPYQICKSIEQLLSEIHVLPDGGLNPLKKSTNTQRQQQDSQNESFSDQYERQDTNRDKELEKSYSGSNNKFQGCSQFDIFKMHLLFSLSSKVLYKFHKLTREGLRNILGQIKQRFLQSLAPAGESVGCLASQSIGEPTTQMTLNTFHLAGISDRNITLGLPRLEQILNCSHNAKNGLITIFPRRPILESASEESQNQEYLVNLLFSTLPELKIGNFIASSQFHYDPKQLRSKSTQSNRGPNGLSRTPWTIKLEFTNLKIHAMQVWDKIVRKIERATSSSYEIDDVIDLPSCNALQNPAIILRYLAAGEQTGNGSQKMMSILQKTEADIRSIAVGGIVGLYSVKLTKRLLNLGDWKYYMAFEASGQSLKECLAHEQINGRKTYSNNPQLMAEVLGIEAARECLLQQFKQVLRPYGIFINYKHLSVLIDWMCRRGALTPVNRNGIHRDRNLSTLTKASFERATDVLFNAALSSSGGHLQNTSQKIIFGQTAPCGTSQCSLMIDSHQSAQYTTKQESYRTAASLSEEGQLIQKTPYLESPTSSSIFEGGKTSYSGISPTYYGSKSPTLQTGPLLDFSPLASPYAQDISPVYKYQLSSVQPARLDYGTMRNSPNYQVNQTSPPYSMLSSIRAASTIKRTSGNVSWAQKKEEDESSEF